MRYAMLCSGDFNYAIAIFSYRNLSRELPRACLSLQQQQPDASAYGEEDATANCSQGKGISACC